MLEAVRYTKRFVSLCVTKEHSLKRRNKFLNFNLKIDFTLSAYALKQSLKNFQNQGKYFSNSKFMVGINSDRKTF